MSGDDSSAFTIQTRGKEIPTVDIELGRVQLKGVLVDSKVTQGNPTGNCTPMAVMSHLPRLVSLKLNCVIKIKFTLHVLLLWRRKLGRYLAILKIEINTVSHDALLEEYPECFQGVGKLKGFQAKLHIDESVKPIAQKLRPPPIGLRDKIEQKLEELVKSDII